MEIQWPDWIRSGRKRIALAAAAVLILIAGLGLLRSRAAHAAQLQAQEAAEEAQRQEDAWAALDNVWNRRQQKLAADASMETLARAKRKIDAVEDEEAKGRLDAEYGKAEAALYEYLESSEKAKEKAQKLVDALWDNTNQLPFEGVNRQKLEDAKLAIDQIPDKSTRNELNATIEKVEKYLAAREDAAREAVESVWNRLEKKLTPEADWIKYADAKALADALPDGDVKKQLLEYCRSAEAALLKRDEDAAREAFTRIWNFNAGILASRNVTMEDLENARGLLKALPEDNEVRQDIEAALPAIESAISETEKNQ